MCHLMTKRREVLGPKGEGTHTCMNASYYDQAERGAWPRRGRGTHMHHVFLYDQTKRGAWPKRGGCTECAKGTWRGQPARPGPRTVREGEEPLGPRDDGGREVPNWGPHCHVPQGPDRWAVKSTSTAQTFVRHAWRSLLSEAKNKENKRAEADALC